MGVMILRVSGEGKMINDPRGVVPTSTCSSSLFLCYLFHQNCLLYLRSSKTTERAGRLRQDLVVFQRGGITSCRLEEGQGCVLVRS